MTWFLLDLIFIWLDLIRFDLIWLDLVLIWLDLIWIDLTWLDFYLILFLFYLAWLDLIWFDLTSHHFTSLVLINIPITIIFINIHIIIILIIIFLVLIIMKIIVTVIILSLLPLYYVYIKCYLTPFQYYYVFYTSFGVSPTIGMSSIRMNSAESDRSIGGTYVQKMFSPKSNISFSSKKNKDEKQRIHYKLFSYLHIQLKAKMKIIIITILSSFFNVYFFIQLLFYFVLFYFILLYFIFLLI